MLGGRVVEGEFVWEGALSMLALWAWSPPWCVGVGQSRRLVLPPLVPLLPFLLLPLLTPVAVVLVQSEKSMLLDRWCRFADECNSWPSKHGRASCDSSPGVTLNRDRT